MFYTKFGYNGRGHLEQRHLFAAEPAAATRSPAMTAVANADNQLATVNGAAQRTFTYDANGNMLTDSIGRVFTWDGKNCHSLRSRPAKRLRMEDAAIAAKQWLKTVTVAGTTYEWDYDYRDRRVREFVYASGGSKPSVPAKQFVWHDNEIVQERVGTSATAGLMTRNHFFGGFSVASSASSPPKYQTLTDHLGNVREIVAISVPPSNIPPEPGESLYNPAPGTIVTRYDYSAYQGPKKVYQRHSQSPSATFQTIGRYYHHEPSGLELALYRAYDPELGRWISEDPLKGAELIEGSNLYWYVANNPIYFLDRDGRGAEGAGWGASIGGFAGGAIGGTLGGVGGAAGGTFVCPGVGTFGGGAAGALEGAAAGAGIGMVIGGAIGSIVEDLWTLFNKPQPRPKPRNAPSGTMPIDRCGLPRLLIHDIKDGIGARPDDWTGIAPHGRIVIGDSEGNMDPDAGHIDDYK